MAVLIVFWQKTLQKRKLFCDLWLAFLLIGSQSIARAQCVDPVLSGPPVWPPYINAETDEGIRSGVAVDLISKILTNENISFEVDKAKPWNRVLKQFENGDIDILFTLLDTAERRSFALYTEYWVHDVYAIITKKSAAFSYSSIDDLKGRPGVMYHGVRLPPPLRQIPIDNQHFTTVNEAHLLHRMLRHGRVDYVLASVASFFDLIPEGFDPEEFHVLQSSAVRVPVYMAISKKSNCVDLLETINGKIRVLRDEVAQSLYAGKFVN